MKVRIGSAVLAAGVSWMAAAGLSTPPAQANPASYLPELVVPVEAYVVDTGLQAVGSVPPEKLVGSVPPEKIEESVPPEKLVVGSVPPEKREASVPPEKLVGSVPPEKLEASVPPEK